MTAAKEKITINGTPPKWSDAEFQTRVESWVNVYHNTTNSMELVQHPLPHGHLQAVIDKAAAGYTIAINYPVHHESLHHACYMTKPQSMQAEDIADIKVKVKNEYVEWLESEHARYQDLLRQQLIQTQQEKELKVQEDKKAKQLAEIEKQVQACYKPLVIPE
ncbi:hypothetical protein KSS93_21210 [Pseudomonas xanthosomatis]|uniref:hypothetical protein n=1 Tax=Pseudomonas xanthosomatis TaxID=2842356 RepID=UPI001C3CD295|nr:hypothetical protein [Pseudomonas xanthosomatis]QXH45374.1 hypothetical protein KSS93_21210 [Pseudomonas xanthosomatis]